MNLTKPQKLIYDMEKFAGGSIAVICGSTLSSGTKEPALLQMAVNEMYRLNDALRIRIVETEDNVQQTVLEYAAQDVKVLRFQNKAELDSYAKKYAKIPLDFHGSLCEIMVVLLPDHFGILAKIHHIISDAWTLALIVTQFNYLVKGQTPPAYSYLDYAAHEEEYLQNPRYERDKAFFLEQFKKCDEVTYLSEKQNNSFSANRKTFVFDFEKAKEITTYIKVHNTSAFKLFMTVLAVYINRVKMNTEKFFIGTALLNRIGVEEKNTMGMFVNTVPMLIELENDKSFAENLPNISKSAFSALRHQKFNYGELLSVLRQEQNFSEKLYDVVLSYQNATVAGAESETTWYHNGAQSESLQIHIDDRDNEGIYKIHYDYLTDKFTEQEIEMLHQHMETLLFDAIRHDNKKIYELQLLTATEQQKLFFDFNDTAMGYPRDKCVHRLFEEQVERTPNKVAVIACNQTLTYAELNEQANQIARGLMGKGIGVGDIVAFALPRKSYLIATMLGILKAGASYMPIDPTYPKDRVDYMVSDSGAKLLVTDEIIKCLLDNQKIANPRIYNSAQDCFCVLHTSGSTGLPKGAAIKHQNMINFIYSNLQLLEGIDYVVAINTVTFDVFEMDTIFALIGGNTCVLASEEQQFNQSSFEQMMAKYKNCLFWATPTKIANYMNNSATGEFFEHINCYVVGGEVLKSELLDCIWKLNPHVRIYTVYGPTETLIYSTITEIPRINNLMSESPKDKCVQHLFEEQVQKTPGKTAVIACNQTLTYAELNEKANRIANSLMEKGVGVGDIIAFALPRNSSLIATMYGIMKSGATYLPIAPDYPQERIQYMLSDSNAKLFITESNIEELLNNQRKTNPNISMTSEELCYCIYTSGSTGEPKGVAIRHRNLINFCNDNEVNNLQHYIARNCHSVLACGSITFDISVFEIILSLQLGKTIVLASERELSNSSYLADLISYRAVDCIHCTPTKLKSYLENERFAASFKGIKCVMVGGEALTNDAYNFIRKHSDAVIFNGYGPTETTLGASFGKIIKSDITIGKPIANTQIYIVDKYMQPTPIGVTGELCIAGAGVGAGYVNRPEMTAEKFVDNPFGKGKLYKTGDLAYWREDGNIAYVGRNDFQVKIRGLRIELGEIESAICSVNGISQAVVVVRKNNEDRQLICAFYTGIEVGAKEIRSIIGNKLPKYMLPHIIMHLDDMPLTTSGKVNRKALPEINLENIANDTEYVAPKTKQQKELCRLMEAILEVSPIGVTDDFFDLGGDSLRAIEFVSKAHNEGIYFNLQNVFDYPTIQKLCDCIENSDKQSISFADVDFTEINKILEKNTLENMVVPSQAEVGNILLAGATGYLGIHILADFLEHDSGIAYCLVRGKDKENSTWRLKELLSFYFGDRYATLDRIEVVCADLQKDYFGLPDDEYLALFNKVDTVINCAASVKHYGSYQYFYEANIETTKRLIEFCKVANAKLIHTSTLSVSGNSFGDNFDGYISETEKHFYESSLYIGQPLENVYARSKFEAERAVLEAIADGLQANIMRMGNLTNRLSDGAFQKNHESNAFFNHIQSVLELGCVPDYLMDIYCEFTPIDEAASAVMTIARHFNTEYTVFHINSTKIVYMDKLVEIFNALGCPLKIVGDAEFADALRKTAKQIGMEHIFETFINDMDENEHLNYDSNIHIENAFTEKYLNRCGFYWSEIGFEYLQKYVGYIKKSGV